MKKIVTVLFFIISMLAFPQGEANIWYFGENAGLDFNSGTPVALTNGQINTIEGCAVLSNNLGQLLFYTDGVTIYNKNHVIMLNGSGLMGNASSTQSATIVNMPGNPNLFYVFTLDAFGTTTSKGLRYSVIDLTLDGGLGGVTSQKNVLLYEPSNEKLAVVKHANNIDYWIVTHSASGDTFYAHLLTPSGINTTPVITNIGVNLPSTDTDYVVGYMKFSPNGQKLAVVHGWYRIAQLFDFNINTGQLSNEITLKDYRTSGFSTSFYGAEFSPNSEVLYLGNSFQFYFFQYDLNAANIPASESTIQLPGGRHSAMQLGPDGKIYVGHELLSKLSVIESPNTLGIGCNLQNKTVDLNGRRCVGGLPSFSQSIFYAPSILLTSNCEGENSSFSFATNQTVLTAIWDFGDGTTSVATNPLHTYTTAGTYTVSVTITTPQGTGSSTRTITIFPKPVLLQNVISLKQCDDNNDGFSAFNLNETLSLLVANPTGLAFSFHETLIDAQNNSNSILNPTTYTNQTVSNDVIFVRITNIDGCYNTALINLNVATTLIPSSFQLLYSVCDDVASGSQSDGIATFNFSDATVQIQALYPSGQLLDITFYSTLADALAELNKITNTSSYTNIGSLNSQNIYVRVDSQMNNDCLGLGHHITLLVEPIPFVSDKQINQCDDNHDGIFSFDTTTLQNELVGGLTNITVSYTDQNGIALPTPLPNPFTTTTQNIVVQLTNNTTTACFDEATISFIVDDLPEAFPLPSNLTSFCDDEGIPITQDGLFPFDTSNYESILLGSQTGMTVNYFDQNGIALSSPLPNPFLSSSQNIFVEVINPLNTNCKATLTIALEVKPIPNIELLDDGLVCSNNLSFTKLIDAGLVDTTTINDFTYQWYLDNVAIVGEVNYTLLVNTEGIYTVTVTNSNFCTVTRTINIVASNVATIENIIITDLSENNTVVVAVSGTGVYEYSLDGITFQSSNTFNNVPADNYTVYVNDSNGCGLVEKDINVLGIPKYFTPNGDGYNDYWNIKGLNTVSNSKTYISIFDRYGKLINQISAASLGWDGTFNGSNLPSTDYWYLIQCEDGRVFKGHFSLKR